MKNPNIIGIYIYRPRPGVGLQINKSKGRAFGSDAETLCSIELRDVKDGIVPANNREKTDVASVHRVKVWYGYI